MLLGQSPFRGDDEDEIFDAILEDEPLYPITMPRDAVSILQKVYSKCSVDMSRTEIMSQLLTRDPARRLGSGKEDAEEIKRQPFFKDVSFDDVMNKRIPPPYFPKIVSFKGYLLYILSMGPGSRTEALTRATLTKNSLVSSPHLRLCTGSCPLAIKRSSMGSPG